MLCLLRRLAPAAQASSEPTGGGCSLVRVRLSNTGHIPTYGSLQSMTAKAVRDQALAQIELSVRFPADAPLPLSSSLSNACRRCCAPFPDIQAKTGEISIVFMRPSRKQLHCRAQCWQQEGQSIVGGGGATTKQLPHLMGRAVQRDHFLPFQASRYEGWVDKFNAHEATVRRQSQRPFFGRFFLCAAFCRFRLLLPCLSLLDGLSTAHSDALRWISQSLVIDTMSRRPGRSWSGWCAGRERSR